ncbi:DUF2225 domain-containing protein [Bacillus xiapuensis]|uniref:DUF2225 domain-containing protein n=1 Tax=Bacillus xiapuensis TaxID=2014075 RepID=UPI000C2514B6|nr:DUF2225 domain-containing protein [Bacillus xiapuensis]
METISPFYQKQENCPLCGQVFHSTKMRTRFVKVADHESDLKPIYKQSGLNPLFYNVKVCCHCGYSFTDDFSPYFAPGVREELKQKISANWTPQDYGKERDAQMAINSYKLALYSGVIKREKHLTLAGLALRIAWIYRDLQNSGQEQRFLRLAAKQYEEAYSKEDLTATAMSDVKVLYLIAELNRRTHHIETAVFYFSKVIEKQRMANDKKIIEMAKDRWYELREENKHSEVSA